MEICNKYSGGQQREVGEMVTYNGHVISFSLLTSREHYEVGDGPVPYLQVVSTLCLSEIPP